MERKYLILVLIFSVFKPSQQSCSSTVGITTCRNEVLKKNRPLKIDDYKALLEFESGNLEEIPVAAFTFLQEITILQISHNKVKKLEVGSFDGLDKLSMLNLYDNQLQEINRGVFRNLYNLKELNLGLNKIDNIHTDALSSLNALETLNLGFNKLRNIPSEINKLKTLKVLRLDNNKLTSISPNTFNNLVKLESLDLSDNEISTVNNDAFIGMISLKVLNIKSNYISNLNVQNILSNLKSLTEVKLSVNSFKCQNLNSIINSFQAKRVSVAGGFSKSRDSVNGIGCRNI